MKTEIAVFGGGCFWCTEAIYQALEGVVEVWPGYAGGTTPNPSYEAVCSGRTGHAEAIKIAFDPTKISYQNLLAVFFGTHDPTTLNRQGNDVGTQYRSIILTTSPEQKTAAEAYLQEAQKDVSDLIVTQIQPLETFYEAEDTHKNYYARNVLQPYCQFVINPKLSKLKEKFRELLKA
ncbi:MAG: peptide-methionine (S)-S-oxide reductase MsrA [Patescibacteria group bacterium]